MGINVEVMNEMLQQVIEEERKDAEKVGERRKAESVAEIMLQDKEPIDRIIHYTKLSYQNIVEVAKRIGVTSLQV